MNFTREPIIETIISPKDGYKLCVRCSKGGSPEEYFVDAIEVVSFGRAFFFRSLERPKAFLVPVSDYEVIEVKETRVALKNVSHERNIKIGGGREAPVRTAKEPSHEKAEESLELQEEVIKAEGEEVSDETSSDGRGDKKRDRRRHRRRRLAEERREWLEKEKQEQNTDAATTEEVSSAEGGVVQDEASKSSSSMFSTLFPPPPTLISETIARYKDKEGLEGVFFSKPVAEVQEEVQASSEDVKDEVSENTESNEEIAPVIPVIEPQIESDK